MTQFFFSFKIFVFLSRALSEYKRQGIDFDYLSAGNEVQLAAVSDCWDRDRYQNWVTNTLCPQLKKDGHDLTKILALDDQTLFLNYWQQVLYFHSYKKNNHLHHIF